MPDLPGQRPAEHDGTCLAKRGGKAHRNLCPVLHLEFPLNWMDAKNPIRRAFASRLPKALGELGQLTTRCVIVGTPPLDSVRVWEYLRRLPGSAGFWYRGCGGIGRRAGFRYLSSKEGGSSSLLSRTKLFRYRRYLPSAVSSTRILCQSKAAFSRLKTSAISHAPNARGSRAISRATRR